MIAKKVTLTNFLSYGPETTIEFRDDECLWMLCGPNGVGKSAIFDAITLCLFGVHRGKKREKKNLVRHGAAGYSVSFEFELLGEIYRISRAYSPRSPHASLEQWVDGSWQTLPGILQEEDVTKWVVKNLGLTSELFEASVLLRQGEADAIIKADPEDRRQIVKTLIGADRFERLGDMVTAKAKEKKLEHDSLSRELGSLPALSPDELTAAEAAVQDAEAAYAAADIAMSESTRREEQAKRYADLQLKLDEVLARLAAAAERSKNAGKIQSDHERWESLDAALPTLKVLVPLQQELPLIDERWRTVTAEVETCQHQMASHAQQREETGEQANGYRSAVQTLTIQLVPLSGRLQQLESQLKTAKTLAELDQKLARFPEQIDKQVQQAELRLHDAREAVGRAQNALAIAESKLKDKQAEQNEFKKVQSGVKCSRCGQLVTAEHAKKEQQELQAAIVLFGEAREAARQDVDRCTAALREAEAVYKTHSEQLTQAKQLETQRQTLNQLGPVPTIAEIELAKQDVENEQRELEARKAQAEKCVHEMESLGQRLSIEIKNLEAKLRQHLSEQQQLDRQRIESESAIQAHSARLPGEWALRWATITPAELVQIESEYRRLTEAGIVKQFQQLQQDRRFSEAWEREQDTLLVQIAAIPAEARQDPAAVEAATKELQQHRQMADYNRTAARRRQEELQSRDKRRQQLERQVRDAERRYQLHERLSKLLGKEGLQRDILRDAEREVVRLADDILYRLSSGELSLQLDETRKQDKAFTLQVRRSDSGAATDVEYLSGSQKFRVAIAVALAIGKYCLSSKTGKPLETVIIDEGFGSLDRQGLAVAAEELKRLKHELKRIILVSHQEEFTENFPAVIQLSRGDEGTCVEYLSR